MNTMILVGSEQVQAAGYQMKEAASSMHGAANNMEHVLLQHQRFMDDWLMRLQNIMEGKKE